MRFCLTFLLLASASGQLVPDSAKIQQSLGLQIQNLKQNFPAAQVRLNPTNGLPMSIVGLDISPNGTPQAKDAAEAVDRVLAEPSVKSLLDTAAGNDLRATFQRIESHKDPALPGNTIVTAQQKIAGIPVFGSTAKFVVNAGLAVTQANFNSLASSTKDVLTTRNVSEGDAKARAGKNYSQLISRNPQLKNSEYALFGDSPAPGPAKLVLFDPTTLGEKTTPGLRLCWEVTVGGMVFFVDANRGAVLHKYRNVRELAILQVNDSKLVPGASTPVLDENGPLPHGAAPAALTPEATNALNNAVAARAFFQQIHRQILGVSDCDKSLIEPPAVILNIRFPITNNSYWDHGSRAAYFSEGFANNLDIVTHELMHGVTDFTSCLTNDADSGAVGEFFSDFFAAMIREKSGKKPIWVIGDGLSAYAPPNEPLRSLMDPNLKGEFTPSAPFSEYNNRGQPATMDQKVDPDASPICSTTLDVFNGCSHFNSGILNRAAFLATSGDGRVNSVTGIGFDKMLAIMNEALSELDELMDFPGTAAKIIESCRKLRDAQLNGVVNADCITVEKAFQTVGIPVPANP